MVNSNVEFFVTKIVIQKDEYQISAGNIGETEFWKSNERQAEVLQFKRAIATCHLESQFDKIDLELIVSLRAGYVRVRVLNKDISRDARSVAKILQAIFANLHHTPGFHEDGAFYPMTTKDQRKYMLCKTYDSHWLIATLHEVKDEKGIGFHIDNRLLQG